jgi:hypothetical protein
MGSGAGPFIDDLYRSSRSIYLSLAMSVVYSIIFIYFLSAFAEIIAWICVVVLQFALIGVAAGGWYMWDDAKKKACAEDKTLAAI